MNVLLNFELNEKFNEFSNIVLKLIYRWVHPQESEADFYGAVQLT